MRYNCLRFAADFHNHNDTQDIISYCISESSSKFSVENDDSIDFDDLVKENITSEQLFEWSVPIDIIEQYEYYLQSNDLSLKSQSVYICTLPRFGSMCQYQFYYYHETFETFNKLLNKYYDFYPLIRSDITCYTHLKCNRGLLSACLDWSEICDGVVNCLDGNFDEEHCWQLELNECEQNEYQCVMGQCIPIEFFYEGRTSYDCLDGSDENLSTSIIRSDPDFSSDFIDPMLLVEDVRCETTFLTSSCNFLRPAHLMNAMFSVEDSSVSDKCRLAFKRYLQDYQFFDNIEKDISIIRKECPDVLYVPNVPIFFGHVFTVYKKNDVLNSNDLAVPYLCSNKSFHDGSLEPVSDMSINNMSCFVSPRPIIDVRENMSDPDYIIESERTYFKIMVSIFDQITKSNPIVNFPSNQCDTFNLYQCKNSSKCIGLQRFGNTIHDCPYGDDENISKDMNPQLFARLKYKLYHCFFSNKYISRKAIRDDECDCGSDGDFCEDEHDLTNLTLRTISFQTLCDGFETLYPIEINGQNHTDETECEQWECDNMYTHCDRVWNCRNGRDQLDCNETSFVFNCSSDTQLCVTLNTFKFTCLSLDKINDGQVNCLGGIDELRLCRRNLFSTDTGFYCRDTNPPVCIDTSELCNNVEDCPNKDDEQFCSQKQSVTVVKDTSESDPIALYVNVQEFFRSLFSDSYIIGQKYFRIPGMGMIDTSMELNTNITSDAAEVSLLDKRRCHRGLDLRVWLNERWSDYTSTCLCPPGYYGNQCQYQNERISLAIRFYVSAESWRIPLAILVLLIDNTNQRIIHSFEQFTYLYLRHCKTKFNLHLFYSTRPKDMTRNYSIHIDVYEKLSREYRASFIYPVKFLFLPVHRLAFIINIPSARDYSCSNHQCQHGKCMKYVNEEKIFCQCNQGWSGEYCHIQHNCSCSSNSSCIGILSDNRSICVCEKNLFGPRCYLKNRVCESFPCLNNGSCLPNDDYMSFSEEKYSCLRPKGFSGDRCEIDDNEVNFIFDDDLHLTESIFIHFMVIKQTDGLEYEPTVETLKRSTISQATNSIRIYWSKSFYLIFIETLDKIFYLGILQSNNIPLTKITQRINSSHHCPSINKLINETFARLHVLRRMKYYHSICQKYSPHLQCFHDDLHLCLCYDFNEKRLANCANFDHEMKFDCSGQNACENGGQCFQDAPECPKRFICACRSCYFGIRCQLSTSEFGLSLDAILAYHIIPNVNLIYQTTIVKISFSVTILFFIFGIINGILSFITFKNQSVREVGCGIYLLGSSITTLLTMIMFALKYFVYLSTQMAFFSNKSFLKVQCFSLDFLLRICLNMDQWLNACIALERAVTVIQGAQFNRKKSKTSAKKIIIILLICNISTSIHDPIYRGLSEEENENNEHKRIWCVVNYSSNLQIYNRIINTFHFFIPFLVNLISSIILITKKSHQQSNLHKNQPYSDELRKQLREHRRLLIAPVVLFLVALPRLILSYLSKCMNSTRDSVLFLCGYFISFIPPIITFMIFVIPSEFYRKEYQKSITQYRQRIQQHLRRTF
ncbi:unnamed protein product [Adineta ricciae]|uniref:Uncharacterized protein n=1 Tax=Adineta ricciae TaxID=249248 RepID=A0A815T8N2_ADIRI|nr:unnamed protein product [Adineta ricciae]